MSKTDELVMMLM